MQETSGYTYWKKPWAKWCVLAAGLLQLLSLWIDLNGYRQVLSIWNHVMSDAAWMDYSSQAVQRCSVKALTAAVFFGILIVGRIARSEKAARWSEGILLLTLALLWGAAGLCFLTLRYGGHELLWWMLLLLAMLGGGIFVLYKSRKP